jgi:diguanylate cyclase (GGDEF)-like protein
MRFSKYATFELLVLIFGVGSIVAFIVGLGGLTLNEVIGQLLLIMILVGALHFGQIGGLVTFFMASVFYASLMVPDIIRLGFAPPIVQLLTMRILMYAIVGLGGGVICSQIKYVFARLDQLDLVDPLTGLYNRKHLEHLIDQYADGFERYKIYFSVLIMSIGGTSFEELSVAQKDQCIKEIGSALRKSCRAVDEVGRFDKARFCLILPSTNMSGAIKAGNRLTSVVADRLENQNSLIFNQAGVHVELFEYPRDKKRLEEVLEKKILTREPVAVC